MTFNNKIYGQLLTETLPRVIETEDENERFLQIIKELMRKGDDKLSPEEKSLLNLLCNLVENFEAKAYPIPAAPPNENLKFFLEDRGLKQKDLVPVFGSEGVVSEILNGKRSITLKTAKKLQDFFGLPSYEFFI